MTVLEDSDPEEWSSHYFPTAGTATGGRGGKKGGYKKVCIHVGGYTEELHS